MLRIRLLLVAGLLLLLTLPLALPLSPLLLPPLCSRRPRSTHAETCGHGGMGQRVRQHAGQRMRGGGGGSHEQRKHCERNMESMRIERWPWREH